MGVILASAFVAGTLIYTLEETAASSKQSNNQVNGFFANLFSSSSATVLDDSGEDGG